MKKYFEKYGEKYYRSNSQDSERIALRMYSGMFKHFLKKKKNVLDFGAGNGFLCKHLEKDYNTIACEISKFGRSQIKINSPSSKIVTSINSLKANSLDGIISLHVLEHIENPRLIIKELSRKLKIHGVFFAVIPNPDGWGKKIKKKNGLLLGIKHTYRF